MKRDMDLVREILLAIEAEPENLRRGLKIEGREDAIVWGHIELLKQAGYLDEPFRDFLGKRRLSMGIALTWQGHEFLESIRDGEIWKKTKSGAASVGSWSITLLGELAKGAIRQKAIDLGLQLG